MEIKNGVDITQSNVVVVSAATSTVDSKVVVTSTAVSTVSIATSTVDSKVVVTSTAVSTVSIATSTVSTAVSTVGSTLAVTSTAVSTVSIAISTVSTATSTVSIALSTVSIAISTVSTATSTVQAKTDLILPGTKFATKTSGSHLTSGAIFNWTGTIGIVSIIGRVTTALEAATPQTIKLTCTPDALSATDLCATKDANAFGVGSLLTITGTLADDMIGTTVVGCAVSQASMITCTCVTSGVISTVFGTSGSKDGVIVWELLWIPLTPGATCVAA